MRYLILIAFLLALSYLQAQPAPPPSHNPAPLPGLVYLAAGGAALAYRQLRKSKHSDNH